MKKSVLVLTILAVGILLQPATAGLTVSTPPTGFGPYQAGSGGEFSFRPSGWDPLPLYDAKATVEIGGEAYFQSFCMEIQEGITSPGTYDVVLNDRAMNGGVTPYGVGDPLSLGTAFLYHEFQKGTLVPYDYDDLVDRKASALALQETIWALEDEGSYTVHSDFMALLESEFGTIDTIAEAKADNNGTYAVAVMNLYKNGDLHQDMLVCVPAPGALLLGCVGLGLVGRLRRRKIL